MPFEAIRHVYLTEDILHTLRSVAVATSNALDAMLDDNPQYRRGNIDAVRAVGQAINVDPFMGNDKAQIEANTRKIHLRNDARNMLQCVYDATVSALDSGVSDPEYLKGYTNALRSISRSLGLYMCPDEPGNERSAPEPLPQRSAPQRQLPAPVQDNAYYLESRGSRTPAGLEEYLARYGIAAIVAAGRADGRAVAEIKLQNVSEARREWAEYVINRWSNGHGWRRRSALKMGVER